MSKTSPRPIDSRCTDCGCPRLSRRTFIQSASAIGAVSSICGGAAALAQPTQAAEVEHLIPENKALSRPWIKSLFERGTPDVLQGEALQFVGMPVGGICCGQLYLGGDGRLWLWDIFESRYSSDYQSESHGVHYAHPVTSAKDNGLQGFLDNSAMVSRSISRRRSSWSQIRLWK